MKKKVVTVTIESRVYTVSYDKKVKNLMVEYNIQVHDYHLKQKEVDNFRFHVHSKNIIFPDGTKTPVEKALKLQVAEAVTACDQKF